MQVALLLGLVLVQACSFWPRRPLADGQVEAACAELVRPVAQLGAQVEMLGCRDGELKRTAFTRVLDELLASALIRAGVPLSLAEDEEAWKEGIPERYWSQAGAPLLAVGYVQEDSLWAYLRLQVVERESGRVVETGTQRLALQALRRTLAAGQAPATRVPLSMQLHLLALHQEGSFAQQVELGEGGRLQAGDRLQLRFEVGADCQVFAFLYSSAGERQDLFAGQLVYQGQMHETGWISLGGPNQVYTLYLMAAPRLDEDKGELFTELAELVAQGQVNQLSGIEKLDQVVVAFVARQVGGESPIQVVRQGVGLGEEEKFILPDGTVLKSRAQQLSGSPALVRAISFAVE